MKIMMNEHNNCCNPVAGRLHMSRKRLAGIFVVFLLFFSLPAKGQSLSGYVVDSKTGEPLAQVSVCFSGTSICTITAIDGFFRLWTKRPVNALVFEADGYEWLEIKLEGLAEFPDSVKLEPKKAERAGALWGRFKKKQNGEPDAGRWSSE